MVKQVQIYSGWLKYFPTIFTNIIKSLRTTTIIATDQIRYKHAAQGLNIPTVDPKKRRKWRLWREEIVQNRSQINFPISNLSVYQIVQVVDSLYTYVITYADHLHILRTTIGRHLRMFLKYNSRKSENKKNATHARFIIVNGQNQWTNSKCLVLEGNTLQSVICWCIEMWNNQPHSSSQSVRLTIFHLQTRKKMLKISFEGCTNVKWNGPSLYLSGSWMDG